MSSEAQVWTMRGWIGLAMGLATMSLAGCPVTDLENDPAPTRVLPGTADLGDGSVRNVTPGGSQIQDGTSNTVQLGERQASDPAPGSAQESGLAALRVRLSDRNFEFSSSSSNSDSDAFVTGITD